MSDTNGYMLEVLTSANERMTINVNDIITINGVPFSEIEQAVNAEHGDYGDRIVVLERAVADLANQLGEMLESAVVIGEDGQPIGE